MHVKRRLILTIATAATVFAGGLLRPSPVRGQDVPAPASRPVAAEVGTLVATLRAANATQAERDEAARRLLSLRTAEASGAVLSTLRDPAARRGQVAIARGIAVLPNPDPIFIEPLMLMVQVEALASDAIFALSNYRTDAVRERLIAIARDAQQKETTRLAAIRAMATIPQKRAAAALMEIVSGENETTAVRNHAADSLSNLTAVRGLGHDRAKWQQWWTENQDKPDEQLAAELMEAQSGRLARLQLRFDRMAEESRAILTDAYQAANDGAPLLLRYLKANDPEVRLAGLKIIHEEFQQGSTIPAAARDQLRTMVADSSSDVRIKVAIALYELNDAKAIDALLAQLEQEPNDEVRAALVEALVPINDLRVVRPLLRMMSDDPSLVVAEAAAKGLSALGKLIREKDPPLAQQVGAELMKVLSGRASQPGTAGLRAAVVEAIGPLQMQSPEVRLMLSKLLNQIEPAPVRRAAARALGEVQPSAADILVQALDDPEPGVRIALLDGLRTSANFTYAESVYRHCKPDGEPDGAVRLRAWETLCVLFQLEDTSAKDVANYADRFRNDPSRRYFILKVESDKLTRQGRAADLAGVQQNMGETLLKMGSTEQEKQENAAAAATYFTSALDYYEKSRPNESMAITGLVEANMDALLASRQYEKAVDFAARMIAANQGNQQTMGPKIRNQATHLREQRDYDGAIKLIELAKKMKPPLADVFIGPLQSIEDDVRQKMRSAGQPTIGAPVIGSVPAGQ